MKRKESSFGKAFLKPFCFAKAFTENTSWKKRFALVEIAIVLCSVFLVALPVIAADQTTQKVSATEVTTTASEEDFVLEIYGNANEDDCIDMRDYTYTARIICWLEEETTFADANYDGRISVADMTQIGLIILGRESELTIVDSADRIVTIKKPIEGVVAADLIDGIRTFLKLDAEDKLVAINDFAMTYGFGPESCFPLSLLAPELEELPNVGSYESPDMELILSLEPDMVLAYGGGVADTTQESTGIPTICLGTSEALDFKWLRLAGYIMDEEERVEELISYANEEITKITDVTSDIPDDEKQTVYLAFWTFLTGDITYTPAEYAPVELAGGINVAEEGVPGPFGPTMLEVSKEQIIAWDPEIILLHGTYLTIEEVLSDPALQTVTAVKSGDVYCTIGYCLGWDPVTGVVETISMAKLFYPDKFADLDVEAECNEIFKGFYGVDGLYTWVVENVLTP